MSALSNTRGPELDSVRARLDALEGKLKQKPLQPSVSKPELKSEQASWGMAIRVSADFMAAIFVGALLGYGLDQLLGTAPFGLIILLLLGFAAGVLNVMRTLGFVAQPSSDRMRQDDAGPTSENHG